MRNMLFASTALALAMMGNAAGAQTRTDNTAGVQASASNAAAPDAPDEENLITVTARQRNESLLEIPLAVSVTTAEQLSRDQIYSLTDLQRITPALQVNSGFGGDINGGGGLRGIRTQAFNPSVAPSVAIVIDQAAAGNVNFPILHDLAQVEVLRGPQSPDRRRCPHPRRCRRRDDGTAGGARHSGGGCRRAVHQPPALGPYRGLAALLGLRAQTNPQAPLAIYGPPGTAEMVAGLLASMKPGAISAYGVPGAQAIDLGTLATVTELRDRASLAWRGVRVSARNNSHYSFAPESGLAERFESLSYRFDLPGRAIVYTGDTGPSRAVEELAAGADLLVAEMMDVDDTIANTRRFNPTMPEPARVAMERHLREHHLLPADVGQMAARARVKAVVVTHFAGRERGDPAHFAYLQHIARHFDGPAVIANDLDAF